jgi:hypothetical protein
MKQHDQRNSVSQRFPGNPQWIASRRTPEEARQEYDIGSGYLCALYDTGIFDRAAFTAEADLLKAAYLAAVRMAEKKAALSADNTESGKTQPSHSSIAIIFSNVKRGGVES